MQETFEPIELENKPSGNRKIAVAVISVLVVVLLAVTAALLVKYFVISTYIVDGISMYPTLDGGGGQYHDSNRTNGEVLYLNKLAKIERGDVVVFQPSNWNILNEDGSSSTLVKRVIAVGGDKIEIKNSIVYLNGVPLEETYINGPMNTPDLEEITIENGYIFCMGDNRDHSLDCRVNGPVPVSCVIGKCILIKGINGKLRVCK